MVQAPLEEEDVTMKGAVYRRFEKKLIYQKNSDIELAANRLLYHFDKRLLEERQVIPVEDILEYEICERYKIKFDLFNFKRFKPEVLGEYKYRERVLYIDYWLYNSWNKRDQRRCRFTMAHEIGHYLLHGQILERGIRQQTLFGSDEEAESEENCLFMTRENTIERDIGGILPPLERQANYFAACLLMPRNMVRGELEKMGFNIPIRLNKDDWGGQGEDDYRLVIKFVNKLGLHDLFDVNVSAMAYRLMQLGLVWIN